MVIEQRSADGRLDRLPALMTEVIARKIDVLVTYSTPGALAAKNATSTVPVVITNMADPIRSGIATNLAHPDGNLTGLSLGWAEGMSAKWLEFLQETIPHLSTLVMIANADPLDNPLTRVRAKEVEAAASTRRIKLKLVVVPTLEALDRHELLLQTGAFALLDSQRGRCRLDFSGQAARVAAQFGLSCAEVQ